MAFPENNDFRLDIMRFSEKRDFTLDIIRFFSRKKWDILMTLNKKYL